MDEIEKDKNTKKNNKIIDFLKEAIPYIIIAVVVILIRTYIVTPIKVQGASMSPTLEGSELMLLNKLGKIERFDIVVVSTERGDIIKRVIAMPGESISCENGKIYVNGRKQEENYSKGTTSDFEKVTLEDNEYFVLGDNREDSLDSRYYGPFSEDKIKGTTNFILFPFNEFGKLK